MIQKIMNETVVYIVPVIDEALGGDYNKGSKSLKIPDNYITAFKRMLIEEKFNLVLNIEGGGRGFIYPNLSGRLDVYQKYYQTFTSKYGPSMLCRNDYMGTQNTLTEYLYQEYKLQFSQLK